MNFIYREAIFCHSQLQLIPFRPANSVVLHLTIAGFNSVQASAFKGYLEHPSLLASPAQFLSIYTSPVSPEEYIYHTLGKKVNLALKTFLKMSIFT